MRLIAHRGLGRLWLIARETNVMALAQATERHPHHFASQTPHARARMTRLKNTANHTCSPKKGTKPVLYQGLRLIDQRNTDQVTEQSSTNN